ncbi:hypothetical protein [Sphingobium ummariense]
MRTSRTYKLQLSGQGIDQFLACHCRVARLAKEFIPYGMTLYVAMSLLDASDPADIAAELESPVCNALGGSSNRFVGATSHLADLVEQVGARLADSGHCGRSIATWRLYNVGLSLLLSSEDGELQAAIRRAAQTIPVRRSR